MQGARTVYLYTAVHQYWLPGTSTTLLPTSLPPLLRLLFFPVPVVVCFPLCLSAGVYLLSLWNMVSGVVYIKVEQWNIPMLIQQIQKRKEAVRAPRVVRQNQERGGRGCRGL